MSQPSHPPGRDSFGRSNLDALDAEFLRPSGVLSGCIRHSAEGDTEQITVDLISEKALNTTEMETPDHQE